MKKGVISCDTKKNESFCSSSFIGKNRKGQYEGGERNNSKRGPGHLAFYPQWLAIQSRFIMERNIYLFYITNPMVGRKLGEFVPTRHFTSYESARKDTKSRR
nr:ribosomal protein S19 [Paspalum millegrana]